jgi:RNA-binding protein
MTLTSKERAELRSEAHHLTPQVHVGHQGVTPTLVQALDDTLRTHELVKVQLGRTTEMTAREAAQSLADAVGADVVQVIGRTVTHYRENAELKRRPGDPPPWRR